MIKTISSLIDYYKLSFYIYKDLSVITVLPMFSTTIKRNKEVDMCNGIILIEFKKKHKKMHWKSWDKLYHHVNEGGLKFKDLIDFNTSMLRKQFWRLMEKPITLFSQLFKRRHLKNTSLLEPTRLYSLYMDVTVLYLLDL